jgi:hypothetical protein
VQTLKFGLTLTVAFVAMAAAVARAAGIARVYSDNRHACQLGLVFHECPKLSKTPSAVSVAISPTNRDPRAYTLQVFKGDASLRALSGGNQGLTYDVVLMSTESSLPAGQGLQFLSRAARAPELESAPVPMIATAHNLNSRTCVHSSVAIGRQVNQSKVHAKELRCLNGCSFRGLGAELQVEPAFPHNQICLALKVPQSVALNLAACPWNDNSAVHREQADVIVSFQREGASVVNNGAIATEQWAFSFVAAELFDGLAYRSSGSMRGQAKVSPQISVAEPVETSAGEGFCGEAGVGGVISPSVEPFHVEAQRVGLFYGWT